MKNVLVVIACLMMATCAKAQFTTAGVATGSVGTYTLTPSPSHILCGAYKAGAIWADGSDLTLPAHVNFNECFTISYRAMFDSAPQHQGADGMCAVFGNKILPASCNATSAYLGYYDSVSTACAPVSADTEFQHSLAVEFDIFDNSYNSCFQDMKLTDHIQISKNADMTPLAGPVQLLPNPTDTNSKDGKFHDYRIEWNCTVSRLYVFVDNVYRISYSFTPSAIFTTPGAVQWGFTGGTGNLCANQVLTSFTLTTAPCTCPPPPLGLVAEPTYEPLAIMPNPNNGSFTLTGSLPAPMGTATVEVVDVLGKKVLTDQLIATNGKFNKQLLLGSHLPNGIYLVRVNADGVVKQVRFTLSR